MSGHFFAIHVDLRAVADGSPPPAASWRRWILRLRAGWRPRSPTLGPVGAN